MTVLALDLGGTNLRAGVASDGEPPRVVGTVPTPRTLDALRAHVDGWVSDHAATRIGLSVAGLVDGARLRWMPNLPWLDGMQAVDIWAGGSVAVGNDAQLALLAEMVDGAVAGRPDALMLAIGTGIGSALVVDGRLVRGTGGGAVSFGWACAGPGAAVGTEGWLEARASGRALDRAAQALGMPDGAALMAAASSHDGAAAALDRAAQALGRALASAVALTGIRNIVLGGSVGQDTARLRPGIAAAMDPLLPPHLRGARIVAAAHGPAAALRGAVLAAHDHPAWSDSRWMT